MGKWYVSYGENDLMHYGTKGHSGVYARQKKSNKNKVRYSTDSAMDKKANKAMLSLIDNEFKNNRKMSKEQFNTQIAILRNGYKALSEPAKRDFITRINKYIDQKQINYIKRLVPEIANSKNLKKPTVSGAKQITTWDNVKKQTW